MNGDRGTVLVVDDNTASRYSTTRLLRAAGFQTLEAATGQQALELASTNPDAIVLDVNLPDIDGFEVCRIIRARQGDRWTPVIHLSASFVDAADHAHGLNSGADGYLTHPVEPPVLVATVHAFIRARSAEEQLRRSEAKFRSVFSHALNGIALLDDALCFGEVNEAMERLLGRSSAALGGTSSLQLVPDEHRPRAETLWQQWRRDGAGTGFFPLRTAAGATVDLEWSISRLDDAAIWLAVVSDITERRAHESEREHLLSAERVARGEAERATRLKDEFLATVSHELRSPLQAVLGGVQVLRLRQATGVAIDPAPLDVIERNVKRQAQLITDLLDVARITSGKMRLQLETVDMAALVGEACESAAVDAIAKSISLSTRIDRAPGLEVRCDPFKLTQIVQNLLTNAVKFTPPGGRIVVTLRADGADAILAVGDSGRGIRSDFLPYIFDTFRQEDGGTARSQGGLGLGLSIVRHLTEMQGGAVSVQSDGEGRGATFTVRLPRIAAAEPHGGPVAATGRRRAIDRSVLRGLRALVVDDEPDSRLVVDRILADHGVVVIEAGSAAEALQRLREQIPDILISDISMPGDDGFDLIRQVRAAEEPSRRLPAIALTALARPEDRVNVIRHGFHAHLSKPVDLEELLDAVATLAGSVVYARPDTV